MEPYGKIYQRPQTVSNYDNNFEPAVNTSVTTSVDCDYEALYNVYSERQAPPYVNPLRQQYTHQKSSDYVGVETVENTLSGKLRKSTTTGPTGGQVGPIFLAGGDALNECLSKVGEIIRGSIDLSIDGFQRQQTVKLVKAITSYQQIIIRGARLMSIDANLSSQVSKRPSAKRRKAKSLKRKGQKYVATREVASHWLEYHYGIVPTMKTVYDLVGGMAERYGNTLRIASKNRGIRGRSHDRVEVNNSGPITSYKKIAERFDMVEIGGRYTPGNSFVETLSRYTSLNPVSILWELQPYSFVVDWFFNVGQYARAMESSLLSNAGIGTFFGYQTTVTRETTVGERQQNGEDLNGNRYSGSSRSSYLRTNKQRSILTTLPFPRVPSFKANLSSGRLLNAAALVANFLPKR